MIEVRETTEFISNALKINLVASYFPSVFLVLMLSKFDNKSKANAFYRAPNP